MTDDQYAELLQGKTLKVYWWLMRESQPHGGRDMQRALRLSSHSLAIYHLDKLREAGLVEIDDDGKYFVTKIVKVSFIKFFMGLGRYRFPRYLSYAVFYSVAIIALMISFPLQFNPMMIIAYGILIFGLLTSWFETIKMREHEMY